MEVPSIVTGFEITDENGRTEKQLGNISIKNVQAIYNDNQEILDIHKPVYENVFDYPESNAFGDVPAYGFFVRHAKNILLEEIKIIPRTCNTRECIYKEGAVGK